MTRTRRMLLGATAGIALLAAGYSTPARAEIPVIDTAALGEWITSLADDAKAYALQLQQYLTQVKQYVGEELSWVTQASQYATQLQQYANELQMFVNFVHYPSLGTAMALLSSAGLGNSLPVNPYAVLGLVNGLEYGQGGLPEISGILGLTVGPGRQVIRDFARLHPDRWKLGESGNYRAGQWHRRGARRCPGDVYRSSHPSGGASVVARSLGDCQQPERRPGHPGAD